MNVNIIEPKKVITPSTAILKKGFAINWYKKPEIETLPTNPQQLAKLAGLDWTLSKRPIVYQTGRPDYQVLIPDTFALTNSRHGSVHGIVKKNYKPTQPHQMIERGLSVCEHLNLEPVGAGYDRGRAYLIANTNSDWDIGGRERKTLLTLTFGLDGKTADSANFMDLNVGCWNMLSYLFSRSLQGLIYDHRGKVEKKQDKFFEILYKGLEGIELEKKRKAKLAEKKISWQDGLELLVASLDLKKKLEDGKQLPSHVLRVVDRFRRPHEVQRAGGLGNGSLHDLLECYTFESANVRGDDDSRIWRNINGTYANENNKVYKHLLSVA